MKVVVEVSRKGGIGCFGSLEVVLPEREEAKDLPWGEGLPGGTWE